MTMRLSPIQKFDVLVTNLTATLNAHVGTTIPAGDNWFVDTRIRDYNLKSTDDFDRNNVMGNPVRYLRVEKLDVLDVDEEGGLVDVNGNPIVLEARYIIGIWLERIDADVYASSSDDDWDTLLWQHSDDGPIGALRYLYDAICWTTGGEQIDVGNPMDVQWPLAQLDAEQFEWAHYVQFVITLS